MKRAVGCLFIILVMLAAFSFASIRIMSSSTAQDSSVAAAHTKGADGAVVQPPPLLTLQVAGGARDGLAASVETALAEALRDGPELGALRPQESHAAQSGGALLTVTFDRRSVFWSPVHARAELEIAVAYASNGDISFGEQDPPAFVSTGGEPALQVLGHYSFADVSWGLISRPGYDAYLAHQIADTIVASLKQEFTRGAS